MTYDQVLIRSCQKCRGTLVSDLDELVCLQCGRRYYPRPELPLPAPPLGTELDTPRRRRRKNGWSMNYYGARLERADQRWWARNAEAVRRLDAGEPVKVIASAVGHSERTIRLIREQLRDLRMAMGDSWRDECA